MFNFVADAQLGIGFNKLESQTKVVVLPEFHFEVAGSTVTLHDTEVIKDTESSSQLFSGSLGADFVLSFKRLVINYQSMFICGE